MNAHLCLVVVMSSDRSLSGLPFNRRIACSAETPPLLVPIRRGHLQESPKGHPPGLTCSQNGRDDVRRQQRQPDMPANIGAPRNIPSPGFDRVESGRRDAGIRGTGHGPNGFFDIANRYTGLDAKNDPLVKIDEVVPWENFRPRLEAAWRKPAEERKSRAGRKPWDAVPMFKAIVLRELYNLSDDQVEYQLRDRLSFIRFLGLGLEDKVPDAKTCGSTGNSWRRRA